MVDDYLECLHGTKRLAHTKRVHAYVMNNKSYFKDLLKDEEKRKVLMPDPTSIDIDLN